MPLSQSLILEGRSRFIFQKPLLSKPACGQGPQGGLCGRKTLLALSPGDDLGTQRIGSFPRNLGRSVDVP